MFRKSWDEIKSAVENLKNKCGVFVAGEHPADEEIETTHVHICVSQFDTTDAKPVEAIRKKIPEELKGQGQYVIMAKTKEKRLDYKVDELVCYITKGDVKTIKEYKGKSLEYITQQAEKWVVPRQQKITEFVKKDKEKTKLDVMIKVAKICDARNITGFREIGQLLIEEFRSNRMKTHHRDLENCIDNVRFYSEKNVNNLLDEVVSRMEARSRF